MQLNRQGCTRTVLLIGNIVVKWPNMNSYRSFLWGILANLEERTWNRKKIPNEPGLPDVLWVSPLGLISVQRRVKPVRHIGLYQVDLAQLIATSDIHKDWWLNDAKPENFGYLKGQLVKIDVDY